MSHLASFADIFAGQKHSDQFNFKTLQALHSPQLEQLHKNFSQFLITGEFIDEYNKSTQGIEKSKFDFLMLNLISLIKKYVPPEDTASELKRNSLVWSNLCGILLCKGNLQIVALETLISTMYSSDFHPAHVSALLYAASSVLYIIQTEVLMDTKISKFEIGLYYLGYLIFKRLLVHLYLGDINQNEAEARLSVYLRNFHSAQVFYKSFSSLEWFHGYICAVCNHIIKYSPEGSLLKISPDSRLSVGIVIHRLNTKRRSSSVDVFSGCVWLALQIWQDCRVEALPSCESIIEQSIKLCKHMKHDIWIDQTLALDIVGDAAKDNIYALLMLQLLASGSEDIKGMVSWPQKVALKYVQIIFEVCRDTPKSYIRKQAMVGDRPISRHPLDVEGKHGDEKAKISNRCSSLMDLLLLRFNKSASDDRIELAWKIRHSSYISILMLFTGRGDGTTSYDYMKTLCWALILKVRNYEDDERVMVAPGIYEITMLQDIYSKDSLSTNNSGDIDHDHKEEERLETKMANILVYRYLPSISSMHKPTHHYRKSTIKSRISMNMPTIRSMKGKGTAKPKQLVKSVKYKASIKPKGEPESYRGDDDSIPSLHATKLVENLSLTSNEILMYTSTRDVTSRLLVEMADVIMKEVNHKWSLEIDREHSREKDSQGSWKA